MVKYETREGQDKKPVEYAVKKPGEITLDDIVGKHLVDLWERNKDSVIKICGREVPCIQILDRFESGNLTRAEYEYLKTSINRKSENSPLGSRRSGTYRPKTSQKSEDYEKLFRYLFGKDNSGLPKSERTYLETVSHSKQGLKRYICSYIYKKLQRLEERKEIIEFIRGYHERMFQWCATSEIEDPQEFYDLELLLNQFYNVTTGFIGQILQYNPTLQSRKYADLRNKFGEIQRDSSVFDLFDYFIDVLKISADITQTKEESKQQT